MRILQVVHQYPPEKIGGTEIYTQNLSRALRNRGHEVIVFRRGETSARRRLGMRLGSDGLKIYTLYDVTPSNPLLAFLSSYRNPFVDESFSEVLEEEVPDLVHFQHLKDLSGNLVTIAEERGLPIIVTLHDYWYICPNAQLVRPGGKTCRGTIFHLECTICAGASLGQGILTLFSPVLSLLFFHRDRYLRSKLAKVELFLSPSHFLKQRYVAQGFPEERIVPVENGVDVSRVIPRKERDGVSPIRFGYLGSIAWQKGVHLLIEAFNPLSEGAELMIYGDLSVFPGYVQGLRELARNPAIHFRGYIPHQQVWQVLSEIDLLVVPSLWYENSPMVIREAFAAGVPVIASRIGALAEKVRDGVDGLHFAAGDAGDLRSKMTSLISNPDRLERLRGKIAPVKSIEENALEMERIYLRLLNEKGVKGASRGV